MHAPNPMIQEPFFSLPVVTPPMTTMGVDPEPVRQEPPEPVVEHERETQPPIVEDVPEVEAQNVPETEALRRSNRTRKSAISTDYKVYNTEMVHMEGDPTTYEEAIKSPHSSKWRGGGGGASRRCALALDR